MPLVITKGVVLQGFPFNIVYSYGIYCIGKYDMIYDKVL